MSSRCANSKRPFSKHFCAMVFPKKCREILPHRDLKECKFDTNVMGLPVRKFYWNNLSANQQIIRARINNENVSNLAQVKASCNLFQFPQVCHFTCAKNFSWINKKMTVMLQKTRKKKSKHAKRQYSENDCANQFAAIIIYVF